MRTNQQPSARFWRRSAAENDAPFLDDVDQARASRSRPAAATPAATLTEREEAESNVRWARAQLQQKMRGPVTFGETMSLGLGAAAFTAFINQEQPRRYAADASTITDSFYQARSLVAQEIASALGAHIAADLMAAGKAAEPGSAESNNRRAARGTTIIPTTVLRPGGEVDGANPGTTAPGIASLLSRGQDASQLGKAVSPIDAGGGIAAIQGFAAAVIGDADLAAATLTDEWAVTPQDQAKANAPDNAAAKASQNPGDMVGHVAAPTNAASSEAKPAIKAVAETESHYDAPAIAAKAEAAAPTANRAPASTSPANAEAPLSSHASGGESTGQGKAAASTSLALKQDVAAAARIRIADEVASSAKPIQHRSDEAVAQVKMAEVITVEPKTDHASSADVVHQAAVFDAAALTVALNAVKIGISAGLGQGNLSQPSDMAGTAKALVQDPVALNAVKIGISAGLGQGNLSQPSDMAGTAKALVQDPVGGKVKADDARSDKASSVAEDSSTKLPGEFTDRATAVVKEIAGDATPAAPVGTEAKAGHGPVASDAIGASGAGLDTLVKQAPAAAKDITGQATVSVDTNAGSKPDHGLSEKALATPQQAGAGQLGKFADHAAAVPEAGGGSTASHPVGTAPISDVGTSVKPAVVTAAIGTDQPGALVAHSVDAVKEITGLGQAADVPGDKASHSDGAASAAKEVVAHQPSKLTDHATADHAANTPATKFADLADALHWATITGPSSKATTASDTDLSVANSTDHTAASEAMFLTRHLDDTASYSFLEMLPAVDGDVAGSIFTLPHLAAADFSPF